MTPTPPRTASARRSPDLLIAIVVVVVFAAALAATIAWPFRTALFPRIVTGTGLLLSLTHLVTLLIRNKRPTTPDDASREQSEGHDDHDAGYVFATAGKSAWAAVLGWAVAFFAGLYVLGLLIAAPVFSFCYLRLSARRSWLGSILYAVVVLVAVYVAFSAVLTIPIPSPIWEQP